MDHQEVFNSRYMMTSEVCQRLCIDPSTLTAWITRGQFPKEDIVVGRRQKLWVRNTIDPIINRINLESPVRA